MSSNPEGDPEKGGYLPLPENPKASPSNGRVNQGLSVVLPGIEQAPYHISSTGTFQEDNLVINDKGITLLKTPNSNERVSGAIKRAEEENFESEGEVKLEDLEKIKAIGRGEGGTVHLARHNKTGEYMALKVIALDLDANSRRPVVQELRSLYACDCPQIIGFYGAFLVQGNIQIAMEYMDAGSLLDIVKAAGAVPEPFLARITQHVLEGLRYLHKERRIMHRDIKPSNITVNLRGEVKICDFGISAELASTLGSFKTFTGTALYMSPERIQGMPYTSAADIWSLGMSVAELALGCSPFSNLKDEFWTLLESIVYNTDPLLRIEDGHGAEVVDLVCLCLEKAANDRPSAVTLLNHPFCTNPASQEDLAGWIQGVGAVPATPPRDRRDPPGGS